MMEGKLLARWETRQGKGWYELYRNSDGGFSYRGDDSGGVLSCHTLEDAVGRMVGKMIRDGRRFHWTGGE